MCCNSGEVDASAASLWPTRRMEKGGLTPLRLTGSTAPVWKPQDARICFYSGGARRMKSEGQHRMQ
eukprot:8859879-Alexandrium_andersonii.AAC.1